MKKIITLSLSTILLLSACNSNNGDMTVEPTISEEKQQEYRELITEAEERLQDPEIAEIDLIEVYFDIALAHDRLGQYGKAIEYYDKVLEINPESYPALNNAASLYEELEMYDEALAYLQPLHTYYKDNEEYNRAVLDDSIRVLVKFKNYDQAIAILEEYAENYSNEENQFFISDQFEFIQRSKQAQSISSEAESQ